MKSTWLLLFVAIVLSFFTARVYFTSGFPYTHDGENHLARFANYKIALKEGQFPPRFAPNLMNRHGYPVFNYNYPLANILSLPFSALKFNYELTFKVLALCAIIMGTTGTALWVKRLGFSQVEAVLAATTYSLHPYLLNLIWVRGNIGELLALGILPWIFASIEKSKVTSSWTAFHFSFLTLLFTCFFLSHNTLVLLFTPVLFFYFLRLWRSPKAVLQQTVLSVSIALTASLWFWLPALLEKKDIVLDGANVNQALIQHFPTLQQLVWSPVSFGFSNPGSIDTLSFSVGTLSILGWLICMLSILKVTSLRKKIRLNTLLVSTLTLLLVLFLAMLAPTQKFWGTIPFVSYIQFPWRLGSIILIFSGVVLAHAYALSNQILRSLIFCTAVVLLIAAVRLRAVDTFHRTNVDYEAFSQSTSTNNENLPKSFNYSNIANWQPSASVLSGDATTSTTSWSGSSRYYVVEVKNLSVIVEPTMYFPGWMTAVVDLNSNKKFNVSYLDSSEIGGRIAYSLEPGTYQIKSYFTQNTWPRMIGNGVSLAAILVWLVVIIFWKKLHKNLV